MSKSPAKPWFKKWWVWAIVVALLAGAGKAMGGEEAWEPAPPAASPTPTAEPTAEAPAPPAVTAATPDEVIAAVRANIDERSSAGLPWAKSVTSVTMDGKSVVVLLDPVYSGVNKELFMEIYEKQNLAEFAGIPFAFNGDGTDSLRAAISDVRVVFPDGLEVGYATVDQLHFMGTGGME